MNGRLAKFAWIALVTVGSGCASTVQRNAEEARKEQMLMTNLQLSAEYLQRGQLEFAQERLEKAVEIAPKDSRVNNMMGLLQWRLGAFDRAKRYFRDAVDAEPSNPEAFNNYGVFLCSRGQVDEAEQWFKKALADPLYKTPADASVNAGVCLMRKPAPAVAEEYFRSALKFNPKIPVALYQMAKINYDSGKTLAARGFIQRFFEVSDDTPESLLLATKIEQTLRNRNQAASYAMRLRGKFPDSPEAKQMHSGRPRQ